MDRRDFLTSSFALAAAHAFAGLVPTAAAAADTPTSAPVTGFSFSWLKDEARRIAATAWAEPAETVPKRFADLGFEQYRDIRWKRDQRIWRDDHRGFVLEPLPAGSVYKLAVGLYLVEGGNALPLAGKGFDHFA